MKVLMVVIVVSNGFGQHTETSFHEFSSMAVCEAAAAKMPKVLRDGLGMPNAFVTTRCIAE